MVYTVDKVDWQSEKSQLQHIRERVFVYELHIPKRIEFDNLDALAQHILVTDNMHSPVATGRLCNDGLIGNRNVYKSLLNFIVKLAAEQGIEAISINCILNEVERFKNNGFIVQGHVFMEAGIPRQRMQCPIACFETRPFTLVH
jgi:predicted GNAT family N-acyltransferase